MFAKNAKEAMSDIRNNGLVPIIEYRDDIFYVEASNCDNMLQYGTATNSGMIVYGSIDYDRNLSIDENIQSLYDYIVENESISRDN